MKCVQYMHMYNVYVYMLLWHNNRWCWWRWWRYFLKPLTVIKARTEWCNLTEWNWHSLVFDELTNDKLIGYWLMPRTPTPLDSAYCNALLIACWLVCQKLNHVSSVQLRCSVLDACTMLQMECSGLAAMMQNRWVRKTSVKLLLLLMHSILLL